MKRPRHCWDPQPRVRAPEAAAAEVRKIEDITKNIITKANQATKGKADRLALVEKLVSKGFPIRKALRLVEVLSEVLSSRFQNPLLGATFQEMEAKWIAKEQKEVFATLYRELQQNRRVTQLVELDP